MFLRINSLPFEPLNALLALPDSILGCVRCQRSGPPEAEGCICRGQSHAAVVVCTNLCSPLPASTCAESIVMKPTHVRTDCSQRMVEVPDQDGPILIPPREFTFIGPGIYLSCLPHSRSLPFLRDHRVQSALFLTPKPPHALEVSPDIHEWMLSIRFKWLETPKVKGAGKIVATPLLVKTALEYILEAPKPILISGYDGVETGALVVSCLRKLQCWDMDAIINELGRLVGPLLGINKALIRPQIHPFVSRHGAPPFHCQLLLAGFTAGRTHQTAIDIHIR